jgi:hypothetical protein
MAVPDWARDDGSDISNGGNGSAPNLKILESDPERAEFEERAAIMEFDGGLSRGAAEAAARLVSTQHRLH